MSISRPFRSSAVGFRRIRAAFRRVRNRTGPEKSLWKVPRWSAAIKEARESEPAEARRRSACGLPALGLGEAGKGGAQLGERPAESFPVAGPQALLGLLQQLQSFPRLR